MGRSLPSSIKWAWQYRPSTDAAAAVGAPLLTVTYGVSRQLWGVFIAPRLEGQELSLATVAHVALAQGRLEVLEI